LLEAQTSHETTKMRAFPQERNLAQALLKLRVLRKRKSALIKRAMEVLQVMHTTGGGEMKKTIVLTMLLAVLSGTAMADKGDNPREVASRLRNDAERSANRGDYAREHEAREAANKAEGRDADGARQVEREYNRGDNRDRGERADRRP
jgi:hypothetical protein